MSHRLLTVVVSYNRPDLLARTLASYRETVTLEHQLVIVDNASGDETRSLLRKQRPPAALVILLNENRYPAFAANLGWEFATKREGRTKYTLLHRSDNDVEYKPGWCEEVVARFEEDERLGQLGLRTLAEEGPHAAVGGNCVIRRELWDAGVRYPEDGWTVTAFEDAVLSQRVLDAGWNWKRAESPCIDHIGIANRNDPYYVETFRVRGITFEQYGF